MDTKKIWDAVLMDVEINVSKANYSTWFKETWIIKQEEGTVFVAVPSEFARDWLSKKFHRLILKALRTISEHIRAVEYIITRDTSKKPPADGPRTFSLSQNNNSELPLSEYYINHDDNLNPRYTFETFVIGPFNELAYAAAQAVIKKPGIVYNPLFFYGNTGHGKTHLIQAVGNYLKVHNPGKKIYYVTSERFMTDYVNSMQANKINNFKEKYRKYDVLIMDDIQFFSNKEKMQEELFHLFNTLYDNNKQIIFSSDRHPNYIQNLEERLKSRFAAGMTVDIPPPDHESRLAILKTKTQQSGLSFNDEIYDFLATAIDGNIRELEGVLNTIICQIQLKNRELSLGEIKSLLKNTAKPKKLVSVKEIIKIVSDFYNIEEASVYEKTRRKEVVKPRQMIMYLLREDFNISYPTIGQKLGGRDHTTVIHSCEKIKTDLKTDASLLHELDQIRAMF